MNEFTTIWCIKEKLDKIYWLINDDEEELKTSDMPMQVDLAKARELVYEVLEFIERNTEELNLGLHIPSDLKYSISQLKEVAQQLKDVKVITV